MTFKLPHIAACLLGLMVLNACATPTVRETEYWQRVNPSEAAFQQGPKVQQMLHRDIGRCVVELRERERLGTLRGTIPTDANGRVLNPDETRLREWETPERDGYLLSEHNDYHDFEGCMLASGWERVLSVPFDVAGKSQTSYAIAHKDYEHVRPYRHTSSSYSSSQNSGPYSNLND